MLTTWNAENINQVESSQRGLSGGKSFRAQSDSGLASSENPPRASGKSMLQPQRKLKPLSSYSENAPPSAAKGKTVGGMGLVPNSSSKPQQKQRRALGDISNAGNGPAAGAGGSNNASSKFPGKHVTPGLKFTVHSDSSKVGGAAASTAKARGSASTTWAGTTVKGRSVVRPDGRVEDIELPMGRMGDEEEVLVERREEQRTARKYANPFRTSVGRSSRSRSQSSSSTSSSFRKTASHSGSKARFGRDMTNTAVPGGADAAPLALGVLEKEKGFDSAIKGIVYDDFEECQRRLAGCDKEEIWARRAVFDDDSALSLDMESVTIALETSKNSNLESLTPLDLDLADDLDDFLKQEVDNLSFT